MADAARAYDYYSTAAPKRVFREDPRPDVRVLPGRNTGARTLSAAFVNGFKIAMVVAIAALSICGLRVWLSASTVQVLQNVDTLQADIEKAYADGSELEIEHSVLESTSRIQDEAKSMGMAAPKDKTYISVELAPTAATNRNGSLSLDGTIENIKKSHAAKK